jgi:tyrosyl-tRNA synthetase
VTSFIHGKEEFEKAAATTEKLFSGQGADLTIKDMESIEGVIKSDFSKEKINTGIDVVSFLAESGIFPSKGEARKTVQGGGISINRKKIEDIQLKIDSSLLLFEKYILVQKGRKNYYLVKVIE